MTGTKNKVASTSKSSTSDTAMQPIPELNPNIPAFIAKLWHMVDDESTNDLIYWGKDGNTFVISDHVKFASELLPHYYKHNNMASFIRQLNMYGFHKIHSVESSSMRYEKMELEFHHQYFVKGQLFQLYQIKRKITAGGTKDIAPENKTYTNVLNKLLQEVTQLRSRQEVFESKMASMKNENDALWREHSILRQKHGKQQKIVNKLIQFLVTLVQQTRSGLNLKRRCPLMIKDNKEWHELTDEPQPTGPIICEIDPYDLGMDGEDLVLSLNQNSSVTVPLQVNTVSKTKAESSEVSKRPKLTAKRKQGVSKTRKRKHSQVMDGPSDKNTKNLLEEPLLKQESISPLPSVTSPASSSTVLSPQHSIDFSLEEVEDMANISDSQTLPTVSFESSPPRTTQFKQEIGTKKTDDLSLVPSDPFNSKEEVDDHLDKIQSDLDLLRDVLKGEGLSLDANTLMELFSVDDPLSLNLPGSKKDEGEGQELISYVPSLVDISEFGGDLETLNPDGSSIDFPELNTPQASMSPLDLFSPLSNKD